MADSPYKISSGVPIPPTGRKTKFGGNYNLQLLEVGDSIFVPEYPSPVRAVASRYGEIAKRRFTTRKVVEQGVMGTRVWRIE